jgi:hypothetical protein
VLQAESHQRTVERQGYANGFNPKTPKPASGRFNRYEKVGHNWAIVPCAILTAIGIGPDGKRSILGCSVQLSKNETHWRSFL